MIIFPIDHLPPVIPVGVQTSKGVMEIGFNVSRWLDRWPDMTFEVWATRPTETSAYPAVCQLIGNVLVWHVSDADTAIKGLGKVEVVGLAEGVKCPSGPCTTEIRETSTASTKEPPSAIEDWYTRLMAAFRAASLPETTDPHQQLVTDSDGAAMWADRLAYTYTSTVEILPETALTYGGEDGGYPVHVLTTPLAGEIEQDKTYTVTYNGAEYVCPAVYLPGETADQDGYILGKASAVGQEGGNDDAPFVLLRSVSYEENGYYAICIALDSATSVTISITGEGTAIAKLPKGYYEQPDQNAMWNEEGYIKNRACWMTDAAGVYVFDPEKVAEYEAIASGDSTAYKITDVPLTREALKGWCGAVTIEAGLSADDMTVVNKSIITIVQTDEQMIATIELTVDSVRQTVGYLLSVYEVGASAQISDITFEGLTPGTWVFTAYDPLPYVRLTVDGSGKWLDPSLGGMPKGSSDAPYLKWSEGHGWTKISLDQLKADLGLT